MDSKSGTPPEFEAREVRIYLDEKLLLNLTFQVGRGECVTIMGPSGSGKSSFLRFVSGFANRDMHFTGRICLRGRDLTSLPPEKRRVGLLMQEPMLFPHLTVEENLLFALRGGDKASRASKVQDALGAAGLMGYGSRSPETLSGGQASRIALMRTLLSDPHLLLLDEPFSKLDETLRAQVRRFVFEHVAKLELPMILVTHDQRDAEAAGGPIFTI